MLELQADLDIVDQAEALQILLFDSLDEEQATRLAYAVRRAAGELQAELSRRDPQDAREAAFRDRSVPAPIDLLARRAI